ncbi:hypothetical protein BTO06_17435 [Tenacibaculum sp. SZ-18]|uniref:hypothetical protein n=1 Tax=Tenacibaculum sp. SZ-18 TaxID=754423 RepID=UPI000C2D4870|nr:hypothetical protein [Tenacibaculum sp. SZ-18]AUC16816.1 hypothetical protein BTO06_17435 [Tenacibaculum sp. SZ-18]
MKKAFLLVLLLISSTNLFSQIDSTKVAFVSYWSTGDSYDFKISNIKQQWKKGQLVKDEKREYVANFTVLDSTDTSYTVKWSYQNDLSNDYDIPKVFLDKFTKYKTSEIIYKTSELGEFLELINWEEIGEKMNNLFNDIINIVGDADTEEKEFLKKAMMPIIRAYSSKEGIEQLLLKEIRYFHFPMGVEFDIRTALNYDEEIANILGEDPIKAKTTLSFEHVNFEDEFCVLKQKTRLDPDDSMRMIKEFFSRIKIDSEEMEKAFENAVFEINDNNTYEFHYNPGVPHKIEAIRESIIDFNKEKGRKIDKTIIELIYEEQ